jgi:DNA replicative helicase MCM subunit Mcm2 (Cdc46/Mcm family)
MPKNRDRVRVMNGTISHTPGGLGKKDLRMNKWGRIVSVTKSRPLKGKLKKSEFYCVACQARCKSDDVKHATARVTGQPMLKGRCLKCDSKVAKFVKA